MCSVRAGTQKSLKAKFKFHFCLWSISKLGCQEKEKRSHEATCRGRAADTDWLTFCFLLLIWFDSLKKTDTSIADVQASLMLAPVGFEICCNFCLFVITWAGKKNGTWDGCPKSHSHNLIRANESTVPCMSAVTKQLTLILYYVQMLGKVLSHKIDGGERPRKRDIATTWGFNRDCLGSHAHPLGLGNSIFIGLLSVFLIENRRILLLFSFPFL